MSLRRVNYFYATNIYVITEIRGYFFKTSGNFTKTSGYLTATSDYLIRKVATSFRVENFAGV